MAEIGSLECINRSAANSIRHRARYSKGVTPTVSRNRAAKMERYMPAHLASSCSVHDRAGA